MIDRSEDRTEWERTWAAMPHRRVAGRPDTISLDPPQYADRAYRESPRCPICGADAYVGGLPATLHATLPGGVPVGLGVWVHPDCFESGETIEGSAPIPW
ncbi:MAG: hypothetical protein U0800_18035 [Isosphaeraceae bacterium]